MTHSDQSGTSSDPRASTGGVLQFPSSAEQAELTPDVQTSSDAAHRAAVRVYLSLHATHCAALERFASRYMREEDAQDIVEQAFVAYWYKYLNQPARDRHPNPERLLFRMVHDAVIDARRAKRGLKRRVVGYVEHVTQMLPRWMRPDAEVSGYASEIARAYEHMPPRTAEVHRLHYELDYSCREIADMVGISINTIKTLLLRGNRIMRDRLERAGYSPSMRRAIAAGKRGTP